MGSTLLFIYTIRVMATHTPPSDQVMQHKDPVDRLSYVELSHATR